jgi:hypothetical protein
MENTKNTRTTITLTADDVEMIDSLKLITNIRSVAGVIRWAINEALNARTVR